MSQVALESGNTEPPYQERTKKEPTMQRLRKKIMSMNNERTRTGMNYEEDTITIVENPVVEVANTFDSKVMEISRRKEVEQEVINEVKQEMLAEAEEEAKLK